MNLTEDSVWTTVHGNKIKFKDMSDEHLVNLFWFLHPELVDVGSNLFLFISSLIKKRGLTKEFICDAPYEYLNEKGEKVIWSLYEGRLINCKGLFNFEVERIKQRNKEYINLFIE